jgi:hypothetical protein
MGYTEEVFRRVRNQWRGALRQRRFMRGLVREQVTEYTPIVVVCPTRLDERAFFVESALAKSMQGMRGDARVPLVPSFSNSAPLADVYNKAIESANANDILVLMHDDVWLDDPHWTEKLRLALRRFDVVGVAGNRRRIARQPAWLFREWDGDRFVWDYPNLRGVVAHGTAGFGNPQVYGPTPSRCKLLDGVMLAIQARTAQDNNLRFDRQFAFHFYDMDFCRSAQRKGLVLGTWPIEITHESGGSFGSPAWRQAHADYLQKWRR